jgi:hypothetical protein
MTTTLRYVDNVYSSVTGQTNFLFRGGEWLKPDNTFDYDGLTGAIDHPVNPPPVPIPQGYYLVVVNLEHADEKINLEAEIEFFADNKDLGQLALWDTNGTAQCYFATDPALRRDMILSLEEWLPDPIVWRVATLRHWLENPATIPLQPVPMDRPIVIYVHCDGGCDRTSEMIGCYRLRYMPDDWTMQDAWIKMYDEHPCINSMGCNNYMATQWYAFWLNEMKGYSIADVGVDGGCNNAGTVESLCAPWLEKSAKV